MPKNNGDLNKLPSSVGFISFNPVCPAQNVAHISVNNIPSPLHYDCFEFGVDDKASRNHLNLPLILPQTLKAPVSKPPLRKKNKPISINKSAWIQTVCLRTRLSALQALLMDLVPHPWWSSGGLHNAQGAQLTSEGEDGQTLHVGLQYVAHVSTTPALLIKNA